MIYTTISMKILENGLVEKAPPGKRKAGSTVIPVAKTKRPEKRNVQHVVAQAAKSVQNTHRAGLRHQHVGKEVIGVKSPKLVKKAVSLRETLD